MNSDQFKINTNCTEYPIYGIKSSKAKIKDLDKDIHKNVEKELKPVAKIEQKEDEVDKLLKNILTIFEKLKLKFNNDEFPKIFKNITGEINQKYNISWPSISVTKDKKKIKMKKIKEMFTHMERLMNEKLNEIEEDTTKPKKICRSWKRIISKNRSLSENKSRRTQRKQKSPQKQLLQKPKQLLQKAKNCVILEKN